MLIISYAPTTLPSSASAFNIHISNSNQQQMHGSQVLARYTSKYERKDLLLLSYPYDF